MIIKGDIDIEENAFSNSNIEEIEFDGVSIIKEKCFADMHRLKKIYFGSSEVCIDEYAFMRTDSKIEYEPEIFGYGTIRRFNMFYNPIIDIEMNISSVDMKKNLDEEWMDHIFTRNYAAGRVSRGYNYRFNRLIKEGTEA